MSLGRARHLLRRVRRVHFVGVGGAGMSGIAEMLLALGYEVSGSDLRDNAQTRRLRELGARIDIGHRAAAAAGSDVAVASSAVPADNPELAAARAARIPVIPRAAMLCELMRFQFGIAVAGAHGKTTTTCLIAHLLAEAGMAPSRVVGGRVRHDPAHAKLGEGDILVCEADESDGSFLHLSPMLAVVTNIDNDHLVNYGGDMARLETAYFEFLRNLPFYGLAVLCADDPRVAALAERINCPTLSYGLTAPADVTADSLRAEAGGSAFTLRFADGTSPIAVRLPLPGRHNVQNALAAAAVARDLGAEPAAIAAGLANFAGIARRFEARGELPGLPGSVWVDDYGHHPAELEATLAAARAAWPGRRLVLAFQPHRYTRTRDLHERFVTALGGADELLLLDVYPAGEAPLPGADSDALARSLTAAGAPPARAADEAGMHARLAALLAPGDVLLTMGAGSIEQWAAALPERLARRRAAAGG